ncbi:MAG: alpha/beta hydrolase, partial [Pseudomonadales bacterium]
LNSHDDAFREFLKHSDELQSKVIPRSWIAAMMEFEKRFQRSGPLSYPVHIIQGTGDTTVDWQYNLPRLEQKFPGTTSYLVADARHHLVNEAPDYRDRVFTLLSEILDEI